MTVNGNERAAGLNYVLVTAARNEEGSIGRTIESVSRQTVLPKRWVIVSDGSTDNTEAIVREYARDAAYVRLVRKPGHSERQFAAKVEAFNEGWKQLADIEYEIIGNLDADVSFGEDFFEFLLDKFSKMPELGVAGTDYVEGGFHSFQDSYISPNHVNGQCQLFRRKCFEDIGGYIPIKGGGIDWLAVTTARMKGWQTRSFGERIFVHHQPMGRTHGNVLLARFHYGRKDYVCGGHPVWQVFRSLFQMTKRPYVLGGFLLLIGFFWSWLSRAERISSKELVRFHRGEQMQRLKALLFDRRARRPSESISTG